jgi:hypothetical protein
VERRTGSGKRYIRICDTVQAALPGSLSLAERRVCLARAPEQEIRDTGVRFSGGDEGIVGSEGPKPIARR